MRWFKHATASTLSLVWQDDKFRQLNGIRSKMSIFMPGSPENPNGSISILTRLGLHVLRPDRAPLEYFRCLTVSGTRNEPLLKLFNGVYDVRDSVKVENLHRVCWCTLIDLEPPISWFLLFHSPTYLPQENVFKSSANFMHRADVFPSKNGSLTEAARPIEKVAVTEARGRRRPMLMLDSAHGSAGSGRTCPWSAPTVTVRPRERATLLGFSASRQICCLTHPPTYEVHMRNPVRTSVRRAQNSAFASAHTHSPNYVVYAWVDL